MALTSMSPAPALPLTGDEALARFRELRPAFSSARLVTLAMDGAEPHARPMGLVGDAAAFGGTLWFFSDDHSRRIAEIARQPRASLILSIPIARSIGAALAGCCKCSAPSKRFSPASPDRAASRARSSGVVAPPSIQ